MFTLTGRLGMFIVGLWPKKIYGLDPRKFSRAVLQGLLSLPRAQLLTELPVCPFPFPLPLPPLPLLPHWGPSRHVECPSLEGHYLLQIGAEFHGLERASPGWPTLFCLGHSDTADESLGESVSRVKQCQAPLHTQTIDFLVSGPDSV